MEGIIWTDLVRNSEELQKVNRDRNVLQKMKKKNESQLYWSNFAWELSSEMHY